MFLFYYRYYFTISTREIYYLILSYYKYNFKNIESINKKGVKVTKFTFFKL